ncbi:hypothetical protein FGO68_gene15146 [Halteria grandinella]|uniref:Uncharacterized protein n=1 Tax=Halteria grandinella TaxID=5974 RepID=A0A8J8SU37_HALGN|nr:hypothetical protein FGO68_gene15146 [Halteria grandinella]
MKWEPPIMAEILPAKFDTIYQVPCQGYFFGKSCCELERQFFVQRQTIASCTTNPSHICENFKNGRYFDRQRFL